MLDKEHFWTSVASVVIRDPNSAPISINAEDLRTDFIEPCAVDRQKPHSTSSPNKNVLDNVDVVPKSKIENGKLTSTLTPNKISPKSALDPYFPEIPKVRYENLSKGIGVD